MAVRGRQRWYDRNGRGPRKQLRSRPAISIIVALLATTLVACGGGGGDAAQPPATDGPGTAPAASPSDPASQPAATPPDSPATDVVNIAIAITDGKVSPAGQRVDVPRGAAVSLEITTDAADEVHVHGHDITAAIQPGQPTRVEFVADEPGLFEVETHDSHLLLVQLAVR